MKRIIHTTTTQKTISTINCKVRTTHGKEERRREIRREGERRGREGEKGFTTNNCNQAKGYP
jgi:hypothetical protein